MRTSSPKLIVKPYNNMVAGEQVAGMVRFFQNSIFWFLCFYGYCD